MVFNFDIGEAIITQLSHFEKNGGSTIDINYKNSVKSITRNFKSDYIREELIDMAEKGYTKELELLLRLGLNHQIKNEKFSIQDMINIFHYVKNVPHENWWDEFSPPKWIDYPDNISWKKSCSLQEHQHETRILTRLHDNAREFFYSSNGKINISIYVTFLSFLFFNLSFN